MSDIREALFEMATKLFRDRCTTEVLRASAAGELSAPLWRALTDAGFTRALIASDREGSGLSLADGFSLLIPAGHYSLPAPLGETLIASCLLNSAGLEMPDGPMTIVPPRHGERPVVRRKGAQWRLSGSATRVPWARQARAIVVLAEEHKQPDGGAQLFVALVSAANCQVTSGHNLASEPRDDVVFDDIAVEQIGATAMTPENVMALGALARSAQIAGALERVLETCVGYTQERVQFGRPLSKFQAIQQNLAILAAQTVAATAAADAALDAADADLNALAIASAKARAGEAASVGAAIAHQVHGAIGFTQEYSLPYSTTRLWSWRDEFGNEAFWSRQIGRRIVAAGADHVWQTITAA